MIIKTRPGIARQISKKITFNLMALAFILIIFGTIFFLKNIGLVAVNWSVVWPLLLVGFGVYVAIVSRRLADWRHRAWKKISKKIS